MDWEGASLAEHVAAELGDEFRVLLRCRRLRVFALVLAFECGEAVEDQLTDVAWVMASRR